MTISTLMGLILMAFAGILFGYQVIDGFMNMGSSNDYLYENIRLESILGESTLDWVDGIATPAIHSFAEAVISLPLVVVLLGGAVFFFLIHFFKSHH